MAATHFHLHPRTHATFESGAMAPVAGQTESTATTAETTEVVRTSAARRALSLVRLGFGFTFLWAFFDKLLALGYATGRAEDGTVDRFGDAAWINGGSPTKGFLLYGADGPFKDFYNNIAGTWWADWLFMAGLLGIGLALTLGIGMRIAAVAGAVLYVLMWSVVLPPENNPVIDEHILGALTLVALALTNAGDTWGLGKVWTRTALVDRFRWLR
jgi:thiosulfate dehydrogenase [quinone] large subunit